MIGDLLAQITGEAGSQSPGPPPPPPPPSKRKANDDLSAGSSKASRISTPSATIPRDRNGATGYTGTAGRPSIPRPQAKSSSRPPALSTPSRPASSAAYPYSASYAARRIDAAHASRPTLSAGTPNQRVAGSNGSAGGGAVASASPAGGPKSMPKKGSYLEIMERAKAAQAAMANMGKIQHKALEKVPTKRERGMPAADDDAPRAGIAKKRGRGLPPLGSKASSARPGLGTARQPLDSGKGNSARGDPNRGALTKSQAAPRTAGASSGAGRRKAAAKQEEEKRPKKAATATTGYQGTARPRPTSSSSATGPAGGLDSRGGADGSGRPGGNGNSAHHRREPRMPFGNPRRSRYGGGDDDDDDDMDDFIEYDDDDEQAEPQTAGGQRWGGRASGPDRGRGRAAAGGRYNAYSDEEEDEEEDESDMEAGLTDIDEEERRAEMQARREDAEQEALERRLKAEKEERKRRLVAGARR